MGGDLEYQAFSVLKVVCKDGSEKMGWELGTEEQLFRMVSDAPHLVVDLDQESDVKKAREFFDTLTNGKAAMEGVVIKPLFALKPIKEAKGLLLVAPMMKVRNPRYLSLIYGPEYTLLRYHDKLMRKKCVLRKTDLSAREYYIGQEMLQTPFATINPSNHTYRTLVAKFLFTEAQEASLDPSL